MFWVNLTLALLFNYVLDSVIIIKHYFSSFNAYINGHEWNALFLLQYIRFICKCFLSNVFNIDLFVKINKFCCGLTVSSTIGMNSIEILSFHRHCYSIPVWNAYSNNWSSKKKRFTYIRRVAKLNRIHHQCWNCQIAFKYFLFHSFITFWIQNDTISTPQWWYAKQITLHYPNK